MSSLVRTGALCTLMALSVIGATQVCSKALIAKESMIVLESATFAVTVRVPFERVVVAFADPVNHAAWDPTFFVGPVTRGPAWNEARVNVPVLGGMAHMRVDTQRECAGFDVYLARDGEPFGTRPAKVRLLRNGDGTDILWTIYRMPGLPDDAWQQTQSAMKRYLQRAKEQLERPKS